MSEPTVAAVDPLPFDRTELRVLEPDLTRSAVNAAVVLGAERGCAAVCVTPENVGFVVDLLSGRTPVIGVVGHPHGISLPATKAFEATALVAHGASAVEMSLALGPIREDDLEHVAHEVAAVRTAVPNTVLRVVVDADRWTAPVLRAVCEAAIDGGADVLVVAGATGPAPEPGSVATVAESAALRVQVVAAGAVRDPGTVVALLDAGATRVATSQVELFARHVGHDGGPVA